MYAYHKLLPLPGECFGLWSACYFPFVVFPLVLCLTMLTSSGVFDVSSFFSRSFLFTCLTPRLRGGGHDSFVSSLFFYVFCIPFLSLRFVFFVFVFSLSVSFRFSTS